MAQVRLIVLLLLAVSSTGGCVPRVVLHTRPDPTVVTGATPAHIDQAHRVGQLLDELQILAHWYAFEAAKNRDKRHWMAVSSVASVLSGAGLAAGAVSPELGAEQRRTMLITSASVALAGALFQILPFAHSYAAKETCYREAATGAEDRYAEIMARCHAAMLDPATPAALDRCEQELAGALDTARSFDASSPCEPPRSHEREALLEHAVRPEGP